MIDNVSIIWLAVEPGAEVIAPTITVIMGTTATLHANAVPGFTKRYIVNQGYVL